MARKNTKSARAAKRGEFAQIQLIGVGLALVLIPTLLSHWIFGQELSQLRILGGLMILVGVVMFWVKRKKLTEPFPTAEPKMQRRSIGESDRTEPAPRPVARQA